ncbi:AI-2E family transporter [Robertkochia marina]|uniref:AI-2E family transporter n=1 Tax=Robertkochia marina TaxID=1227945 RepID=A0A4S3LZK8_9FLAO|nr:AI-2E family transporter [Robertkochia marina]THD66745.1 AI-2E family transporter [Robertkochia marina]TRZ42365.1 AI-2E family transporter [Robertkochia marina]
MNSRTISNGILRAVGILTGIVLLCYFLFKIQSVIAYVLISVVISLIGRPLVIFLRKRLKFNNTLAVITTMALMILFIAGIVSLFIPLVMEQSRNLSLLDYDKLLASMESVYQEVSDYLNISRTEVEASLEETLRNSDLLSSFGFSAIPSLLNNVLGGIGTFSFGLFTVIFISFFFLKDSGLFQNSLMALIPDEKETRVINSLEKIKGLLSRYFIGLILQITVLFVFYTIVLLIVGIENALVIAFLCALLNLIPYIGPLIGGALMIMLTMSSNLGSDFSGVILPKAIYVFIGFLIGQLIDNFFSQPFIFSSSVKSHPLEIFLIIIIAGLLFGVLGMVIAIPAYTAVKVVLKEFLSQYKVVKSLTKNL